MATPPQNSIQPKIGQKLLLRTAILLFILAGIFTTFRWFQGQQGDFDRGSASTGTYVAALQYMGDGTRAVLIAPDGTIKTTKSWNAKANDRDLAWRPDGRFLFFVSDRSGTYHVYRWNPDRDDAEPRTVGTSARMKPTFSVQPTDPDRNETLLMVSRGTVMELDPRKKSTPQVLPPAGAEISQAGSGDESGTDSLFASSYGALGTSFKAAQWCGGKKFIVAIMGRDSGEVLLVQDMTPKDGKLPKPHAIVAGDKVEFAVNPKDGTVVYTVQGFQWPDLNVVPDQFTKGNKITTPVRHLVGLFDPASGPKEAILGGADDRAAFGSPAISPDGSTLILVAGPYDRATGLQSKTLITMPCRERGGQAASPFIRGEVFEPTWSPDGESIAYAKRVQGKRDIYEAKKDGSSERNLTGGKGNFASPLFSPQIKP